MAGALYLSGGCDLPRKKPARLMTTVTVTVPLGRRGRSVEPAQGVGMSSKAYAYLLGFVAIIAGVATMVLSSSRLIDIVGGAAVLGGLGAAAWAAGGVNFLRNYIAALLISALISGAFVLVMLMSRP
jgi:hypothetical protein